MKNYFIEMNLVLGYSDYIALMLQGIGYAIKYAKRRSKLQQEVNQ